MTLNEQKSLGVGFSVIWQWPYKKEPRKGTVKKIKGNIVTIEWENLPKHSLKLIGFIPKYTRERPDPANI
jgi:hypothetical protein